MSWVGERWVPNYVDEFADELVSLGEAKFLAKYVHPVLVVEGVAGELRGTSTNNTAVAVGNAVVQLSRLVGKVFHVTKASFSAPGPVVLGRTVDNDVVIPETSISKRHCFFKVAVKRELYDCGSTNGTLVNGTRVVPREPYALEGGEQITLGRLLFLFHSPRSFAEYLRHRVARASASQPTIDGDESSLRRERR